MIEKELVAASTEPLILSLLARDESYGYELIQEVKRLSGDKIKWTDRMPVLHRMEDNGWIKNKREQWTVISSVPGGLWKGQHV